MNDADELTRLLHDRTTPLDPELEPFMEDSPFGPCLKHPLVFQVPFHSGALANRQLEQKRKALAEAIDEGKWMTAVWIHERPYRIEVLLEFADHMDDRVFWEVLGAIWTDSENIWQNDAEWRSLWASERPGREFAMDDDEREGFKKLPDIIQVYRGCISEENEDGMSWTTDLRIAEFFAKRFAQLRSGDPIILCGTAKKADVLFYGLGRNESEVVVLPESVHVSHLRLP
jgi:hypothetical protein